MSSLAYLSSHPLVKEKLSQLRDKKTDSKRFRELVKEIGSLLGYEATANLQLKELETVDDNGLIYAYII